VSACSWLIARRATGIAATAGSARIWRRRNAAFLRRAMLDPKSALTDKFIVYQRYISFPGNFLQVRVADAQGRHITGARLDEDAFTIQIRDYSGKLYSFDKSELKELHKDWGETPMPSYRGVMGDAQLDDLVAYLASLRGKETSGEETKR
jgi:hypothetical protein